MTTGIGVTTCQTAFGWVGLTWSDQGLVALTLPSQPKPGTDQLPANRGSIPRAGLDVAALVDKLRRYLMESRLLDEPLDPTLGTDFQRRVWAITRPSPVADAHLWRDRPPGRIAAAARAVGQSMARNPWPIVVPCHRVLGSDGSLTGLAVGWR